MKRLKEDILCAGQGGQGIMVMGRLLAYAAMNAGYHVTWIPSYGAEVRGGTAHSMIRIRSKGEISNPVVSSPTICIVMNKPSLFKFIGRVRPNGILFIDSTEMDFSPKARSISIKKMPFTKMAIRIGDKRAANMIALGAMNKVTGLFSEPLLSRCLSFAFKGRHDVLELSRKALQYGFRAA